MGIIIGILLFLFCWMVLHGGTQKKITPTLHFEQRDEVQS